MVWWKILANITYHKKFVKAGPIASWLWVGGNGYARLHQTDGVILAAELPLCVPGLKSPAKHAASLVAAGLWEVVPGGWAIHDFHDWHPSKADSDSHKRSEADRKKAERERRASERTDAGQTEVSGIRPNSVQTDALLTRAKSPSDSVSVSASGLELEKGAALAYDRPKPRQNYSLVGSHIGCFQSAACGRGLCVPSWLGSLWVKQFHDDEAPVSAFIRHIVDALPPGPVGDPVKFWKAQWDIAHPTVSAPTKPQSRAGRTLQNGREAIRETLAGSLPEDLR